MDFKSVFPLIDSKNEYLFQSCHSNEEFLAEIIKIYFFTKDARVKESALAVYMAYRDHYPKYLSSLTEDTILTLNTDLKSASGKIIKLRRLALSALSKVA